MGMSKGYTDDIGICKVRGFLLEVLFSRSQYISIVINWGLYWRFPILGNYHIGAAMTSKSGDNHGYRPYRLTFHTL